VVKVHSDGLREFLSGELNEKECLRRKGEWKERNPSPNLIFSHLSDSAFI
jgi:hypothetical protein